MRTVSPFNTNPPFHFTSGRTDFEGDESLISDIRSHVKPVDLVEHKLQRALQSNRQRNGRSGAISPN